MTATQILCRRPGKLRWRGGGSKLRLDTLYCRKQCMCSCDLVKPSQRLQRLLLHSTSASASFPRSPKEEAAELQGPATSLEEAQEHLRELKLLVNLLPLRLQASLLSRPELPQLLEVVLDLGRPPLARFPTGDWRISEERVSPADLAAAVAQVGSFGDDNRAGIDRTLHRISCMRNRDGAIVGLTCRVGRAITGSASLAADLAVAGKSILILGTPGVGKTTAIRELSRHLSEECQKRVVIVDTSNEIGGDGDIPHTGVGNARRMQVSSTAQQHRVMIEAVENHMPEVIVIDEIGTKAEATAARTISQRGVQLIATAHGGHLENIMKNPALLDLIGGIQSVVLGDEAARRRQSRKTVRERAGPPTFDVAIELLGRRRWCIYPNIAAAVDRLLLGQEPAAELREQDPSGRVHTSIAHPASMLEDESLARQQSVPLPPTHPAYRLQVEEQLTEQGSGQRQEAAGESLVQPLFVYSVGLDPESVNEALSSLGDRGERLILTADLKSADVVLAKRSKMRAGSPARDAAKAAGVPVYGLKNGDPVHLLRALETLLGLQPSAGSIFDSGSSSDEEPVQYQNHVVSMTAARNEVEALEEVRQAIEKVVLPTMKPIELLPRVKDVVAKQAALAESAFGLATERLGNGVQCRLRILPGAAVGSSGSQGTITTM